MAKLDIPLILIGALASAALLIPALDVGLGKVRNAKFSAYFTLLILAFALLILTIGGLGLVTLDSSVPNLLQNDLLGVFFGFVVILVALLVTVASFDYMKDNPNVSIYYSFLLFTSLGMVVLSFAVDLLMIFVAWELMSLPTFILAGFMKKDKLSNEAAVKYFILGALSSGILLYGMSIIFGLSGSTNLNVVLNALTDLSPNMIPVAGFGAVMLIAGFGLKLSIVPFHMWIPDAYEGAPTTVSALLSAATKKAGFVAAIRVFAVIFPLLKFDLSMSLAIIAIATMTLGNIAALTQKSITRMLAYSSIAQGGYLLIGLVVLPTSPLGLSGLLYHSLNHALLQATAFIAVAAFRHKTSKTSISSYNGLARVMPITAFSLMISLLGLVGIPPLNGFWSKLVLFTAAADGGFAWLALGGLVNSAISLGYYGIIVKRMYMDEPTEKVSIKEPFPFTAVLLIASMIIILTGIFPGPIYEFASRASIQFLSGI
ncbi:MAG: NADH-quinone oxidoreductase subunit N [Nitrososphaerales archaeon]